MSWANHMHSDAAWAWFSRQEDNRFFFCRFTQIGLLRLLATSAVMGKDVRTIGEAWKVYDRLAIAICLRSARLQMPRW